MPSVWSRLAASLLLSYLLCIHSSRALSSARFPPVRGATLSQPTAVPAPSIRSVSGCLHDSVNSTSGCNQTSVLTITGSNFANSTRLVVASRVSCPLPPAAQQSSSRLVAALCPYYYPQDTSFELRVDGADNSSAALASAVSFHGTAPHIDYINSSCSVPPFGGCDPARGETITVVGHYFLSHPAPIVNLYVRFDTQYWPCYTSQLSLTRFVCRLLPFSWAGDPPSPARKFGVLAAVVDANWLKEEVHSNFVPAALSFNSPSAESGSTGVQPPPPLPIVQRVSGCEDSFSSTRNCPWPYSAPVPLRLIGAHFTAHLDSLAVYVHDLPCPIVEPVNRQYVECAWDTNGLDWAELSTRPLTVSLSSSAGWVNMSGAVSLNTVFASPSIESVSGCAVTSDKQARTAGCDRSRTLTLYGDAFARYLPASLSIAHATTVQCIFPLANPLTIECPLHNAQLGGVVRNVYVPVQLHLGDRTSEAVPYISFAPDVSPPVHSSSGGGGAPNSDNGAGSADELVGMKLALLSMMIISLIVLVVALAVWVTGWWLAHRRSYVSQYGQAAVDSRQVLLQ